MIKKQRKKTLCGKENYSLQISKRFFIKYRKNNLSVKLNKFLNQIDQNYQDKKNKKRLSQKINNKQQNIKNSHNKRIPQLQRVNTINKIEQKMINNKENNNIFRRNTTKKKILSIQDRKKKKFIQNFCYFRNDLKQMIFNNNDDRIQNLTQYNHILLGIHVAQTYYPKIKQIKKFQQTTKKIHTLKKSKNLEYTKILLLFDLDQTLIHTLRDGEYDSYEDKEEIWIQNEQKNSINFYVNIRPYTKQLLQQLYKNSLFSLGVFTASEKIYADKIIQLLDPQNKIFSYRFYRDSCQKISNFYTKNLQKLENINIKTTILIDNCPYSYIYQPNNAIPIFPFLYEKDDKELIKLQFLIKDYICKKIKSQIWDNVDVRQILKRYFKLQQYINYLSVKKLILQLYPDL